MAASKPFLAMTFPRLPCKHFGRPRPTPYSERPNHQAIPEAKVSGLAWPTSPALSRRRRRRNDVIVQGRTDPAGRFDMIIGLMSGLVEIVSNQPAAKSLHWKGW